MRDLNTPLNIAVLISGTGSNMVAIAEAIQAGQLNAKISYVVASNPRAKGIAKAQEMGLDTMVFTPEDYAKSTAEVERTRVRNFRNAGVDYVIMAGYMRKCTGTLLLAYPNRVVNLHPALLPKHKGAHAIQDAFEAGDEVTGEGATGRVFHAEIHELGPLPESEMAEVRLFDGLPENLTYPAITPELYAVLMKEKI